MEEETKIAKGFDRGVDFNQIKDKLVATYNNLVKRFDQDNNVKTKKNTGNKIIYTIIALIQLRNGSRISEACKAFIQFMNRKNISEKVIVKISKSESIKYKKGTNETFKTKARYRKMMFPSWIKVRSIDALAKLYSIIPSDRLRKRVLDYLLINFNCNTHSLRYAFINYMLYDQKKEMAVVAKFVGHVNVQQLVTYTQQKNCDKLFDIDI